MEKSEIRSYISLRSKNDSSEKIKNSPNTTAGDLNLRVY
jgi:hypothetical protein